MALGWPIIRDLNCALQIAIRYEDTLSPLRDECLRGVTLWYSSVAGHPAQDAEVAFVRQAFRIRYRRPSFPQNRYCLAPSGAASSNCMSGPLNCPYSGMQIL